MNIRPCLFIQRRYENLYGLLGSVLYPGLDGVQLLLHVADNRRAYDVPFAVDNVGRGIAADLRDKLLIKCVLR